MFSGSHIDKDLKGCIRPRRKNLIDKMQSDPSFKNLREGRRSGLPPSNYSEKVARDRGPAYHKSPSRVSSQRLRLPEAPEPPSAVRPRKANVASAGRSTSRRDDCAPPTQRAPNVARSSHSSYASSSISAARDRIPQAYSTVPSQRSSSVASSTVSNARSRVDGEYASMFTKRDHSVAGSSKSGGSRHSNSRHSSEHRDRSPAPTAYSYEEHETFDDYEYEGSNTFVEVQPDESVSVVGKTRFKRDYAQSLPGLGTDRNGFPKYMPTKRSLYTGNERHAPYNTVNVTPRSMYEGIVVARNIRTI